MTPQGKFLAAEQIAANGVVQVPLQDPPVQPQKLPSSAKGAGQAKFFVSPIHSITYGFLGNSSRGNLEYPGEEDFSIGDLITSATERRVFSPTRTQK